MKKIIHTKMMLVFLLLFLQMLAACGADKKTFQPSKTYVAAVAELNNGNYWYKKGCYESCLEHIFKAHELYTLVDNQEGVAKSLNNIGTVYRAKKDSDSAIIYFDEAIRIYKNIHDFKGLSQALSNKSAVYIDLKGYDKAENILDELEQISLENKFNYLPAFKNRAILLTRQKKYLQAEIVLNKALSGLDERKQLEYSTINYTAGILMHEIKKYRKAEEYFIKALMSDRNAGFNKGVAEDLFAIGSLFITTGDYWSAADYLQRCLKVYTLLNDTKNAEKTFKLLDETVNLIDGAKPDLTVTKYFFDLWSNGQRLIIPCD